MGTIVPQVRYQVGNDCKVQDQSACPHRGYSPRELNGL
jgi:hypothetical protein